MVSVLLLTACGTPPIRTNSYIVQTGDTLYSIAARSGLDYRELARLNNIASGYLIYPGQTLRLSARAVPLVDKQAVSKQVVTAVPGKPITSAPLSNINWQWPSKAQSYAATTRPNGGVGLSINGRPGQDILATASGKVVYAGNGLLGYGQLIIIKHDEVYLSAYAHLQTMLIQEGMQVVAGQKIATMGNGASGDPLLYFEIRVNGMPVEPLPLLGSVNDHPVAALESQKAPDKARGVRFGDSK